MQFPIYHLQLKFILNFEYHDQHPRKSLICDNLENIEVSPIYFVMYKDAYNIIISSKFNTKVISVFFETKRRV